MATSIVRRIVTAAPFLLTAVASVSITLAGVCHADDDDDDDYYYDDRSSPFYSPDTYADPATDWVPWASGRGMGNAQAPQVDTSVHCDGCAG